MSENMKTGLFVGIAALVLLLAYVTVPTSVEPEFFSDEGDLFFEDFTDASKAASLEVIDYEEEESLILRFKVESKDGRWTIPSHSDYPADAKERMATAAGLLIGLRKGAIRSDRPADYAALGVIDPDEGGLELAGVGTRVSFSDATGNVLAALIIGKEVEGKSDVRFVRVPGSKRTYQAKLPGEINARFSDWIETDLLQLSSWDIHEIAFDSYSVDERTASIVPGEKIQALKKDSKWTLADLVEGEEMAEEKLQEVTRELDDLKIVGVRPKPEGLDRYLKSPEGLLTPGVAERLQSRGYFVTRNGDLVSNEGDLVVTTSKGVVYTLRFGEVYTGRADQVSAGGEDPSGEKAPGGEEDQGSKANRYLMVTVEFSDAPLGKPEKAALPDEHLDKRKQAREAIEKIVAALEEYKAAHEGQLPETLALLTEGDGPPLETLEKDPWENDYLLRKGEEGAFTVVSLGEDKAAGGEGVNADVASDRFADEDALQELASDWKEFERKATEGREEVEKLSRRFGPWYYVISSESFDKLNVQRAELVKAKEQGPPPVAPGEGQDSGPPPPGNSGDGN